MTLQQHSYDAARYAGIPAHTGSDRLAIDSVAVQRTMVFCIAAMAFSYQLTTPILLKLVADANISIFNLMIKGFFTAGFCAVTLAGLLSRRSIGGIGLVFMAYLGVLGLRLLYDILALDILPIFQTKFYVLSYYFGLIVIPTAGVLLSLRPQDTRILHKAIFWMLVGANLALTIYILGGGIVTPETAFSGRFEVAGDLDQTAVLNPIGVSAAGAFLASFAIGRLAMLRSSNMVGDAFNAGMVVLGIVNLLAGGSRGPLVGFVLALLTTLYAMLRGLLQLDPVRPRRRMWAYGGLMGGAITLFIMASRTAPVYVFDRFYTMFESRAHGGQETRDYLIANALSDFAGSPFIGSSYLTSIGQEFPHNVVVDTLMATGIVGFALFFIVMMRWLRGLFRMLHGNLGPYGFAIALVSICMVSLGMTSGAAWQNPDFWVMVTVALVLGNAPAPKTVAPLHA